MYRQLKIVYPFMHPQKAGWTDYSYADTDSYLTTDRLTRISGNSSITMTYEPNGNIAFKEDMGYYRYNDGSRTHALTDIEEPTAELKGMPTQNAKYTEFNKVESVHEGAYKIVFWYGADEQRVKSELYRNALRIRTIYYGDGVERHIDTNGNVKEYTYLDSDGGCFGMVVTENETSSAYYFHTDMLGSLIAISDARGVIVERRSYDAWGRRRNPNDWTDYKHNNTLGLTLIGYTFQEEMPEFNLINLNGRLYDPMLGRMLSPDPFIQDAENSQNYNRYSYCWNNPMKYNDPTGNFIFSFFLGPVGAVIDGMLWSGLTYSIQAKSNWNAGGFFKSMIIGGISGAVGGAAGSILKTTGFISGAINGAIGGFVGGMTGGSLNAWTSGASFMQGLKVGLKSGGYGAIGGALIGGISSGIDSSIHSGNFWTGKGATFINEMVLSSGDDKIYDGDLGGDYFKDNETLHKFVKDEIGWEPGKYGIDNIDAEGIPTSDNRWHTKYFRSEQDGTIFAERIGSDHYEQIGGLTLKSQISTFKNHSYIYMSPFSSQAAFSATLNHEMIHAYHRLVGLEKLLGSSFNNYTEQVAHNYNYQYGNRINAAAMLKRFHYSGPFGGKEFWPPWLIPLPRVTP